MKSSKVKPLTMDEFVKSITMFYIDLELEEKYCKLVEEKISTFKTKLLGIAAPGGLEKCIRENKKILKDIISLLNISEEKFKRIVTTLRIEKKYKPTTEWNLEKIQSEMISSPAFMEEICDLLSHGAEMEKYESLIPKFYLNNFSIDATTIGRLANDDDVRRLIKRGIEGNYNNKLGDSYFNAIQTEIGDFCKSNGLTYEVKKVVPLCGATVNIVIPSTKNPRIVINAIYGITTSSSQTNYAKAAEKIAAAIRKHNEGKLEKEKTVFINIVDGAGWVARNADLEKLERCSNFLVNMKNLSIVKSVITHYLLED